MYNRYMPKVQDISDYIELDAPERGEEVFRADIPDRPPQMPSFYGAASRDEPRGAYYDPPRHEERDGRHDDHSERGSLLSSLTGGDGLLGRLLSSFHMPKLELDDILLLLIAFLVLREEGDDDLVLIVAALYLFGGKD